MKAPPERLSYGWAKFFAGIFFGAIISWMVFIYMYGVTQEKQVVDLSRLEDQVKELRESNSQLIENQDRLNKENKKKLTVQEIKVIILNASQHNLNKFTKYQLIENMEDDLNHLLTQDIRSVARNRELLRKAIENKVYKKDDRRFRMVIDTIYFDTVLEITVKIKTTK